MNFQDLRDVIIKCNEDNSFIRKYKSLFIKLTDDLVNKYSYLLDDKISYELFDDRFDEYNSKVFLVKMPTGEILLLSCTDAQLNYIYESRNRSKELNISIYYETIEGVTKLMVDWNVGRVWITHIEMNRLNKLFNEHDNSIYFCC